MHILFPEIGPYAQHKLAVDPLHTLYIEECGYPGGIPVLVIHGGPGSGCNSADRRFFDPGRFRIILFDQRGCGRSTPHGSLINNTTHHLVDDIEAIRRYLGIEQWLLFAGSWGAALALSYAQRQPQQVSGCILRGTFLCRPRDIDWSYAAGNGASRLFPDIWDALLQPLQDQEKSAVLPAYYRRLQSGNELEAMHAARSWNQWLRRSFADPQSQLGHEHEDQLAKARIHTHYLINYGFLKEHPILDAMETIRHIPAILIHGRLDTVCPIEQSYLLHKH